ncbi:DUF998 domain-containing protein [Actinoplanes sp. M2I2]|uniref:DUF998 domain-containing protein n=1 Tax=Actinoplanes sp. M2I2 TaxID=1734444 RepID=UPI00201FF4AF|nr:DUF998 domain-containing protein [Actinoplanes sp. M2I2]
MESRSRAVTVFAGLGVACVLGSLGFYAALHFVGPSSELDWSRRTISQYALLENGWWFDAATLLLAAGSVGVLLAASRAGVVRGGAAVALALWVAGLVGVVWFEKHNWSMGPSMSGDIHRVASVVAFLSLPVAALLAAARAIRDAGAGPARGAGAGPRGGAGAGPRGGAAARSGGDAAARWVGVGGVVSLLCFTPILWAVLAEPWTGVRWWRAIPLGGVERLLGLAEVLTLLLIAGWAVRARIRRSGKDPVVAQG